MSDTDEYQASTTDPHAFVACEGQTDAPDYQWVCAHLLADLIVEMRELTAAFAKMRYDGLLVWQGHDQWE